MIRRWGAWIFICLYVTAARGQTPRPQSADISLPSDVQSSGIPQEPDNFHPSTRSSNELSATDSCTPEKAVAWNSEIIQLHLWKAPDEMASQFDWTVTGGHVEGRGKNVRWNLTGVQPGYYTARVTYAGPTGPTFCSILVVVEENPGRRGISRETGHALLTEETNEREGYGLYSYVLLGAPPDEDSRACYLKVMEAFLQQLPAIEELEKHFDRKQLNITFVPVTEAPPTSPSAQWLLDHYDYARARFMLHALEGDHSKGPYIISSFRPLGKTSTPPYLSQNFSYVPPRLVPMWVTVFMNQAAQEHFWEATSMSKMVPILRTAIAILAEGLPDVRNGLDSWVKLAH